MKKSQSLESEKSKQLEAIANLKSKLAEYFQF